MKKHHDVQRVFFTNDEMELIVDGVTRRFDLKAVSLRLFLAAPTERVRYKISPSGYGIHWPLIDEDLSIDGLPGITPSSELGL